jgi:hypothetical protein
MVEQCSERSCKEQKRVL